MNDIKTWQQGVFAPLSPGKYTAQEAEEHSHAERHKVRPGLRENAICHCPDPQLDQSGSRRMSTRTVDSR